ncbi:MAG TPA: hypothetical protein VH302_08005 [Bryobacteraceae bacterium]|jgi:hypothetical protein|nr:hypothetical protein [Bryobacteraceae bacterium]
MGVLQSDPVGKRRSPFVLVVGCCTGLFVVNVDHPLQEMPVYYVRTY